MLKKDIEVGKIYYARVGGNLTILRVVEFPAPGPFSRRKVQAVNLKSGRTVSKGYAGFIKPAPFTAPIRLGLKHR